MLEEMLRADRSVRRFDASFPVGERELLDLVALTRFCASGRNLQPLRYRLVTDASEKDSLFQTLKWAGYYTDWDGPSLSERPSAYIVQCIDTYLAKDCLCDDGLHLQTITLGATAIGLSCCIIKAFDAVGAVRCLHLPERFSPRYVVAVGKGAEKTRIVGLGEDGDYRYFRDAEDTQCVPKRSLEELIIPAE